MIELRLLSEASVECGESFGVMVVWRDLERPVREFRVSAYASVVVDGDTEDIADASASVGVPVDAPEGVAEIEVAIPVDGPTSYDGELFTVEWRLSATLDVARARDTYELGPAFDVIPSRARLHAALETARPPEPDTAPDPPE